MNPDWCEPAEDASTERIREQRDRYATAIANVAVYTAGRTDLTGAEIADLLAGQIPERLRTA